MNLDSFSVGSVVKINKIGSIGKKKRKLVDMGITKGEIIEITKVAPLGDPIEVKVKGYKLSFRKEEAKEIDVKILKGE